MFIYFFFRFSLIIVNINKLYPDNVISEVSYFEAQCVSDIDMLTLPYHLVSLKWVVPAAYMYAPSPAQMVVSTFWHSVGSAILPRRLLQAGDEFLWSFYQRLVLFFYEHFCGIQVYLYGDASSQKLADKENVILLMNHQSSVDWVVADMLAVRQGCLGHIRYVLKDTLKYIPLYGYCFYVHNCIYVKRGGKFQQKKAIHQLQAFRQSQMPFWMVIFPEGTRFNPEKSAAIASCQDYARLHGLQPLNYHMTPRYKAAWLCVSTLRDKTDAVYDLTVGYSQSTDRQTGQRKAVRGLTDFLQAPHQQIHLHMDRIPMSSIPQTEDEFAKWMYHRFLHKDKLMQYFYSSPGGGTFPSPGVPSSLSLWNTLPSLVVYTAVIMPLYGTCVGRQVALKSLVYLGLGTMAWVAVKA